jgi:hypothetical protein
VRILIGCETSGMVREVFRARGHEVWSCDLLPSEDISPWHIQGDVRDAIADSQWDMLIVHPECTYICGSGLHWNDRGRGWEKTDAALGFVRWLLNLPIPKIALENPVGLISTRVKKATQYIQPWQFGHDASKKTGLWLKGLPPLEPTEIVPGREVLSVGKLVRRWANQTDSGQNKLAPSPNRWKERSRTYRGIAEAMAGQWGGAIPQDLCLPLEF